MEEGSRSERIMSEETGRSALSPFAPPEIAKRRNSASKVAASVERRLNAVFIEVSGCILYGIVIALGTTRFYLEKFRPYVLSANRQSH